MWPSYTDLPFRRDYYAELDRRRQRSEYFDTQRRIRAGQAMEAQSRGRFFPDSIPPRPQESMMTPPGSTLERRQREWDQRWGGVVRAREEARREAGWFGPTPEEASSLVRGSSGRGGSGSHILSEGREAADSALRRIEARKRKASTIAGAAIGALGGAIRPLRGAGPLARIGSGLAGGALGATIGSMTGSDPQAAIAASASAAGLMAARRAPLLGYPSSLGAGIWAANRVASGNQEQGLLGMKNWRKTSSLLAKKESSIPASALDDTIRALAKGKGAKAAAKTVKKRPTLQSRSAREINARRVLGGIALGAPLVGAGAYAMMPKKQSSSFKLVTSGKLGKFLVPMGLAGGLFGAGVMVGNPGTRRLISSGKGRNQILAKGKRQFDRAGQNLVDSFPTQEFNRAGQNIVDRTGLSRF